MIPLSLGDVARITHGEVVGDASIEVTAPATVDSRAVEPGGLFAAIAGEHVDGHDYAAAAAAAGAAAVLSSRPTDAPGVVVDDVTIALGLLARHVVDALPDLTVLAITGSQGKTSVKDMLAHLLAVHGPTIAPVGSFNNELGVPLTVLRADTSTRFLVVEMGARGVGHIATLCRIAPPDVSVVLNVGTAHLGEFGSVDNIARAKGEIVEALGPRGVAVLNADDPRVAAMASRTVGQVARFGTTVEPRSSDVVLGDVVLDERGEPTFTLGWQDDVVPVHVPQVGAHQAANAAAAIRAAMAAGVGFGDLLPDLATATASSPMRMERHVRRDGVVVLNDAYNANPASMAAALRALAAMRTGRTTWAVLGEMLELGATSDEDHRATGRLATDLGIDHVVAVGKGARPIADGAGPTSTAVADVTDAVAFLQERLRDGDVVLVKASRGSRLERVADALLSR